MSDSQPTPAIDMIRWTFSIDPARRDAVVSHLADLGLDVHVRPEGQVVATWDEPEEDLDELVEALWAIHGTPFEIAHEEFQRLDLSVYHDEGDAPDAADRAVA